MLSLPRASKGAKLVKKPCGKCDLQSVNVSQYVSARQGKCLQTVPCYIVELTLCPSPGLTVCVRLFLRVVKEEISDDNAKLPCFNGRVVSWVSEMDGALLSSGCAASARTKDMWSTRGSCKCRNVTPPQSFFNTLHLDLTVRLC